MFNYLCVSLNPQPPDWFLTENTELTETQNDRKIEINVFCDFEYSVRNKTLPSS